DLRLDREDDHVAVARDFGIGAPAYAVGLDQLADPLRPPRADENLLWFRGLGIEQTLEQRLAHVPGADEPELFVGDHVRRIITPGRCRIIPPCTPCCC